GGVRKELLLEPALSRPGHVEPAGSYAQLLILRGCGRLVKHPSQPNQSSIFLSAVYNGTLMNAIAVIPARLASTRLPRKMLREIGGIPLVGVVYQSVRSSELLAEVIIATDSE